MANKIYLYAWYCEDWGAYFYVGTGSKERVNDASGRSKHIKTIIAKNRCRPVILADLTGKSAEEIHIAEVLAKQTYRSLGHPIIDGEPEEIRRQRQSEGIAAAKAKGVKFGRPTGYSGGFDEVYPLVTAGEMTVVEACEKLNISRTQWYRMIKTA